MSSAFPNLSNTIRAVLQPEKASHKLVMTTSHPVPTPTHPEDVLVKVHATSPCLGELDWALWAPDFIGDDKVPIPGQDVTGTAMQSNSGQFRRGDIVYCRIMANRSGGAAEYTLSRATKLAIKPWTLSWVDAAATPLSALTAYQASFEQGTLWAAAVGLAGAGAGAGAGADGGLDGSDSIAADEEEERRDAARAHNAAHRVLATAAAGAVIAVCGALVSICQPPDAAYPADLDLGAEERESVRALCFVAESHGRDLDIISRLLELGGCRSLVDSVLGFDDFERRGTRWRGGIWKQDGGIGGRAGLRWL